MSNPKTEDESDILVNSIEDISDILANLKLVNSKEDRSQEIVGDEFIAFLRDKILFRLCELIAEYKIFKERRSVFPFNAFRVIFEEFNSEVSLKQLHVEKLSGKRIIKLTKDTLPSEIQKFLEELMEKRQETALSRYEQLLLDGLMKIYDDGLLLKSEALRVAVERGLIEPLSK
jgi:hypothetical protein